MDNKKRVNIMLRPSVEKELDRLARTWGLSRSEMVARLVQLHWGDDLHDMAPEYAERLVSGAFMP
jgi:metal-responsive CopG/Arc/MetJ family transcriptional regulator